jgi:mercuric ion transport protein
MASSCCWLPPILIVMGVSSAGMIQALETYRPLFMVVTFGFLGTAFYFTYRPHRAVAGGAEDCCAPISATGKRRFNMMALNKVMLWGVTVMAVVFLFFPGVVTGMFAPDPGEFTAGMDRTFFTVEGMTCEG